MTLTSSELCFPKGVSDLEPRAWDALKETTQSVSVTAGAGAGKTEFLAQKASYLLQTGICPSPKRILAISFKRDAARNLSERVGKRCPLARARRFDSMTFDAFTKSFLDRFRAAIPEPLRPSASYRITFPGQADQREFLERHGFSSVGAQNLDSAIATSCLPIDEANATRQVDLAVARYWRSQYQEYNDTLLTFPMINRLVEWLLRENPMIKRALQVTYPFVFLDEFQDTTFAQFDLLKTAFEGSNAVFTAVGDDKQRIMGWAGAMPDSFSRFESQFSARRITLLFNWRSHEDLVRIQHVIAQQIDQDSELPIAQGKRTVDGDVAAIWEFQNGREEAGFLAEWIKEELMGSNIQPHDIAILVRLRANEVEQELASVFSQNGLRLRNVARNVGDISIQDLLCEDLTATILPLLRLGSTNRSPKAWNTAQKNMEFLEGVSSIDETAQEQLQLRLQGFVRELRITMNNLKLDTDSAENVARKVLDFVGVSSIRKSYVTYQRQSDFNRVWQGFLSLLCQCAEFSNSWSDLLDEFEGLGQIPLMTIHRSKGLEFHTMIFYGLDNRTWWSLTPNRAEELNSFLVAFTRAKQRSFFTLCIERGQAVSWIENLLAPAGVSRINMSESPG